jgi:hypothetical protein
MGGIPLGWWLAACARVDSVDVNVHIDPLGRAQDFDQDGIVDDEEKLIGTDVYDADTDLDGIDDGEELLLELDPVSPDTDQDAVLDGDELDLGIDPTDPDTDDGGVRDGDELLAGTDPIDPDDDPLDLGQFVGGGGCGAGARAWLVLPLALVGRRRGVR